MNTSVLTAGQKGLLRSLFAPLRKRLRHHDPLDILDAVCYLVTTGCKWRRLPDCYPPHTTVYHHWTARSNLDKVLGMPVSMRRAQVGPAVHQVEFRHGRLRAGRGTLGGGEDILLAAELP